MNDKVRIAFVVAAAKNGVIGREGELPWRLPSDLKRFRSLTLGKPVIMGRKTYQSIGKALAGRDNIVLSRRANFRPAGVYVVARSRRPLPWAAGAPSSGAVRRSRSSAEPRCSGRPWRWPIASTSPASTPHRRAKPGSTRSIPTWRETAREAMPQGPGDQYPADFIVLDRKKS